MTNSSDGMKKDSEKNKELLNKWIPILEKLDSIYESIDIEKCEE